jgi:2-oxoglutarate dehydrogenase complex dehydrogenase (E1) component-like enzyme
MGCWNYVRPRIRNLLVHRGVPLKQAAGIRFIGREANGSPATGYEFIHKAEEKAIVDAVFSK